MSIIFQVGLVPAPGKFVALLTGQLGTSFDLLDKMDESKRLRVDFKGAVPDTFKPDVEVIVEGSFSPDGQVFKARTLVTKCPSKYEKKSKQMEGANG